MLNEISVVFTPDCEHGFVCNVSAFADPDDAFSAAAKVPKNETVKVVTIPVVPSSKPQRPPGWSVGEVIEIVRERGYEPITNGEAIVFLQSITGKNARNNINREALIVYLDRHASTRQWKSRTKDFKVVWSRADENEDDMGAVSMIAKDGERLVVIVNRSALHRYPKFSTVTMRVIRYCSEWDFAVQGMVFVSKGFGATGEMMDKLWGGKENDGDIDNSQSAS